MPRRIVIRRIKLRGGHKTSDRRLDRLYQEDLRSLNFLVGPSSGTEPRKPRSYTHKVDLWLDQGADGACVGFSFAHDLAARPVVVSGVTERYAKEEIYWEAQKIDWWEGGSFPGGDPHYEGTSVLAGAQVLHRNGFLTEYLWGIDHRDIAETLGYLGPVVLGIDWHEGMFETDVDGFVHPTGKIAGGHAILAIGVKIKWKSWINKFVSSTWDNVDLDKSYILLHNSWGQSWGQNGRAKLALTDLNTLMSNHGEAVFPVRNKVKKSV